MPAIRTCPVCGRKNRVPAKHLADTGQCGACKNPLPPVDEPLEVDPEQFDEILREARVPGTGRLLGRVVRAVPHGRAPGCADGKGHGRKGDCS